MIFKKRNERPLQTIRDYAEERKRAKNWSEDR